MPINRLYHTCLQQLRQLRPGERITRLRSLATLISGILLAKSVHLAHIALHIPGRAKERSITRRLERLLDNRAVRVREYYQPIARAWLLSQARSTGQIRLILDTTKVSFSHQLLMVGVAFGRRAIPIAWSWLRCAKGHSSARVQLALLGHVRGLLPLNVPVLLVGDTEFEAARVQEQLELWGWSYVLRQKPNNQIKLSEQQDWQAFGSLVSAAGERVWLSDVYLTRKHTRRVNLLAEWVVGEKQPWLLATNLATAQATLRAYRRRMWIEELFGDLKGHGFDLESSHLQHFARLSRLTLAVVLLYDWLVLSGKRVIKRGQRTLVDRNDRRDLSIFQIGFRFVLRCLKNAQPFTMSFAPPILKLSGS
jgi:hypothetical protein